MAKVVKHSIIKTVGFGIVEILILAVSGIMPFVLINYWTGLIMPIRIILFAPVITLSVVLFITASLLFNGVVHAFFRKFYSRPEILSMLTIFPDVFLPWIPPIFGRNFFEKLFGAKIGDGTKICIGARLINREMISVGKNCLIGSFSVLTGHLEEYGKYHKNKIRIGNNVLVGGGTWIFPGVQIMDNVIIGARSFVPKNKILEKGTKWVGSPVKKIN